MKLRSLLIWGVIALVLVVLFATLQGPSNPARGASELTYSQMLEQAEAGRVTAARTQGNAILLTMSEGQTYVSYVPEGAMADTVRQLRAAGVNISAARPPSGPTAGDVILGLLPMFLLIGAWYFFMRQMQRKGRPSGDWPD